MSGVIGELVSSDNPQEKLTCFPSFARVLLRVFPEAYEPAPIGTPFRTHSPPCSIERMRSCGAMPVMST